MIFNNCPELCFGLIKLQTSLEQEGLHFTERSKKNPTKCLAMFILYPAFVLFENVRSRILSQGLHTFPIVHLTCAVFLFVWMCRSNAIALFLLRTLAAV